MVHIIIKKIMKLLNKLLLLYRVAKINFFNTIKTTYKTK